LKLLSKNTTIKSTYPILWVSKTWNGFYWHRHGRCHLRDSY